MSDRSDKDDLSEFAPDDELISDDEINKKIHRHDSWTACSTHCKNQRWFQGLGMFGVAVFFFQFHRTKDQRFPPRINFYWPLALISIASVCDYILLMRCLEECNVRHHRYRRQNY